MISVKTLENDTPQKRCITIDTNSKEIKRCEFVAIEADVDSLNVILVGKDGVNKITTFPLKR